MKHFIIAVIAFFSFSSSADALGFEMARQEALYLTDKMAYELYLSREQMEAVYEINLDYMLNVNIRTELFGTYWLRRNSDLQFVLSPYQYEMYMATNYFYRPLLWVRGAWSLAVYGRYTDRHFFYYSRPVAWSSFRGGRNVGASSFYRGRHFNAPAPHSRPTVPPPPAPGRKPGDYNRPDGRGHGQGSYGNTPNSGHRPNNSGHFGNGNNSNSRYGNSSPNNNTNSNSRYGQGNQNNRNSGVNNNSGHQNNSNPSNNNRPKRQFGHSGN